jgi:hypothetical protein
MRVTLSAPFRWMKPPLSGREVRLGDIRMPIFERIDHERRQRKLWWNLPDGQEWSISYDTVYGGHSAQVRRNGVAVAHREDAVSALGATWRCESKDLLPSVFIESYETRSRCALAWRLRRSDASTFAWGTLSRCNPTVILVKSLADGAWGAVAVFAAQVHGRDVYGS